MKGQQPDNKKIITIILKKRAAPNIILTGGSIDFQVSTTSNQKDHEIYVLRNSTKMRHLLQVK